MIDEADRILEIARFEEQMKQTKSILPDGKYQVQTYSWPHPPMLVMIYPAGELRKDRQTMLFSATRTTFGFSVPPRVNVTVGGGNSKMKSISKTTKTGYKRPQEEDGDEGEDGNGNGNENGEAGSMKTMQTSVRRRRQKAVS